MKNISILLVVLFATVIIVSCQKETTSASCSDGILNGSETGVDCGGDCSPCFNCNDGIQNGSETGVDCGGSCSPCIIIGCTNPLAHNYNSLATQDDNSCETCEDNIYNGDEEGLDCGGAICNPCPQIGDSGQAAGLIFYDKGSYSNGWRYLEYGIEIQGGDKVWGCRTNCNTSFVLGSGFENSNNVIDNYSQGSCSESPDAFIACDMLTRNNYSDWYLPSLNEMQELYQYRNDVGLSNKRYWTSSESDANTAYIVDYGGESNGVPFSYTWAKVQGSGQGLGSVVTIRRF